MSRKFVIIGTSAVGIAAARTLRRLDPHASIVCISREAELPYNKCFLADYAAGIKTEKQVITLTHEAAQALSVELKLSIEVVAIDADRRVVRTRSGEVIVYDELLIATGSSPFMPPIPGITSKNVFTFHTWSDVHQIIQALKKYTAPRIVIIGAGLTGLECADALMPYEAKITLIERADQLGPSLFNKEASAYVQELLTNHGVEFRLSSPVVACMTNELGYVKTVQLSSGEVIDADLVICVAGVVPNAQLAAGAGIIIQDRHIVVNGFMQTSVPHIYAAGDCILAPEQRSGYLMPSRTWPDAIQQGVLAAQAMAGAPGVYKGRVPLITSSFFGISCLIGRWHPKNHENISICNITIPQGYGSFEHDSAGVVYGFTALGRDIAAARDLKIAFLTGHSYRD